MPLNCLKWGLKTEVASSTNSTKNEGNKRETVWVDYLLDQIEGVGKIIVDDIRYENELVALKKRGFIIIYLGIDKETQLKRLQATYPDTWKEHVENINHQSEGADRLKNSADLTISHKNIKDMIKFVEKLLLSY